jgi:hypothetical protein
VPQHPTRLVIVGGSDAGIAAALRARELAGPGGRGRRVETRTRPDPALHADLQTWTLPEPDRWDVDGIRPLRDQLQRRVDGLIDTLVSLDTASGEGVSQRTASPAGTSGVERAGVGTDAAASAAARSPAPAMTATIAG